MEELVEVEHKPGAVLRRGVVGNGVDCSVKQHVVARATLKESGNTANTTTSKGKKKF